MLYNIKNIKIHMNTLFSKDVFRKLLPSLALALSFVVVGLSSAPLEYGTASFFKDPDGVQTDSEGNIWYVPGYDYEGNNFGRARVYDDGTRKMVLTQMLAADPTADTCNKACGKLTGSNGQSMRCVDNVSSFPYLNNQGGKLFYPHAQVRVSTYPGHGAHGGNYDILCLGRSSRGDVPPSSTCSATNGLDTITTCPQCAKNMDPGESIGGSSNFADGVIVACAETAPIVEASDIASIDDAAVSLPPAVASTEVNGEFIVEVQSGAEAGVSECAKEGKVCVGAAYTNRKSCTDFYPHAEVKNASEGYEHDFFCKGGSDQSTGPCAGITTDTCFVAVSSGDAADCESPVKEGVDSTFMVCEDPFSPELIESVGGFIPPVSAPVFNTNTGNVDYTLTISHPLDYQTSVKIEYSTDGGINYVSATLAPSPGLPEGQAKVNQGTADERNSSEYQIGSLDPVDTDLFSEVAVDFHWNAYMDIGSSFDGLVHFKITVKDVVGNTVVDISPEFSLDTSSISTDAIALQEALMGEDRDGDGVPNNQDPDIDGDGIVNLFDIDVDGDGLIDLGEDADDDMDGLLDEEDDSPTGVGVVGDIDGDGILDDQDIDMDGDGIPNNEDLDRDGDGIPDAQDEDLDGDGLLNDEDPDVDGDGVSNLLDRDADGDGIPNLDDDSAYGRDRLSGSLGQTEELKGSAPQNCLLQECGEEDRLQFFEDLMTYEAQGSLDRYFQGTERNIADFVLRLLDMGYSIEELTQDGITRRLAVDIATQVLLLRGNLPQESLDAIGRLTFPDVSDELRSDRAINAAAALDIVGGYPTGEFLPERETTQVEAAKVIVNTAAKVSQSQIGDLLKDIQESDQSEDWYVPYLKTLEALQIDLILNKVNTYQDYQILGGSIDLLQYLQLFDLLSEVIGIDNILSFGQVTRSAV